jgi:hypothetical protein
MEHAPVLHGSREDGIVSCLQSYSRVADASFASLLGKKGKTEKSRVNDTARLVRA